MTALAHRHAAFAVQTAGGPRSRDRTSASLALRATEDGWSLLAPDGQVVFRALGTAGRRRCLEFAHELGVLAVFS
jgi:hypothetical protein